MIGAAAGVITGLVGSALDFIAQEETNDTNIRMTKATNAMNYKMFKEQNDWNLAQWNRENDYNSPEEQAKRLQNAGINPAYVFGNGSVAEASHLQSATPAPAQAPHVEAPKVGAELLQGAQTAINAFNQSQLINAQVGELNEKAHGLSIDNELKKVTLANEIENSNLDNAKKRLLFRILQRTEDAEVALKHGNVAQQNAMTDKLVAETGYLKVKQELEVKMNESQINLNNAQIDAISQSIAQRWQEIAIAWDQLALNKSSVQAQNAYLGNLAVKIINDMGIDWEQIGISKELLGSEKFKNYVSSGAQAVLSILGIGAAVGKGMKVGKVSSAAAGSWPMNGYGPYAGGYSMP